MGKIESVEEYMQSVPANLIDVARELRPLISAGLPTTNETLWHGQPVWMSGKTPVAMLKAYTSYVTFALFQGQTIDDASGRLEAGSQKMASVKLREVSDIDRVLFSGWLSQAEAQVK